MTNEEFIKSVSKEGEVWKDVPGYENYYIASNLGRVASLNRSYINSKGVTIPLKPSIIRSNDGGSGYHYVTLCKDKVHNKLLRHRVIALTFLDNPENKPLVDHINGDKTDCRVENLRWATYSENMHNETTLQKFKESFCAKGRTIVCLKNNKLVKIYQYPGESKQDGFCPGNVIKACDHIYQQCNGYQFMYYDEYNQLLEKDQSLN